MVFGGFRRVALFFMLTSLFNFFPVARYHQFLSLAAFTRNRFQRHGHRDGQFLKMVENCFISI
jgi:hypothetical protein